MANILENLNERQLQAVTAPEKSVLILAGAGSGKTRVLTTRIAWLLEKGACRTSEILAVTFTNKAAREMLTRLETMLPYDLRNMWVGTFHGLCNRILRRHAEAAGLPKTFQILDSGDQLSMVKRIMKANNVDTETVDPRKIQSYINWQKEHGIRSWSQQLSEDLPEQVNLYRAYEEACQREGVVDFGELLLRCYELLDRNEIVRSHYQGRFRHILVDEFQDTNVLQYRWLQVLAGLGAGRENASVNAVFAVGDDDQSIYAFRGANVGNMADFVRDFRTGEPIRLEQNYRSTSTILNAANAIISHNDDRLGKNLWTSGAAGDKILLQRFDDDTEEARDVKRLVMKCRARGDDYADCAVLYRMNAVARSRTDLHQRRDSLPHLRRPALLRARRSEARPRLHAPSRQPDGRHELFARRELPDPRDRREDDRQSDARSARHADEPLGRAHDGKPSDAAQARRLPFAHRIAS